MCLYTIYCLLLHEYENQMLDLEYYILNLFLPFPLSDMKMEPKVLSLLLLKSISTVDKYSLHSFPKSLPIYFIYASRQSQVFPARRLCDISYSKAVLDEQSSSAQDCWNKGAWGSRGGGHVPPQFLEDQ